MAFAHCIRMTLGESPAPFRPQGVHLQYKTMTMPHWAGGMNDRTLKPEGPREVFLFVFASVYLRVFFFLPRCAAFGILVSLTRD